MRAIIIIALIAFFTSCKAKQTESQSENEVNVTEVRDSLEIALGRITLRMEELGKESERLLEVSSPENPIVKNLEAEYLRLLVQKEEILLQLADLDGNP